jgi:hypothetical protein
VLLEESDVVSDTDQRPRVPRQRDNGAVPEDGVDGAAVAAMLAYEGAVVCGPGAFVLA